MTGTGLRCSCRIRWFAASMVLSTIWPSAAWAGSANPRGGTVKEVPPPPTKGGGSYRLHDDIFLGNDVSWRNEHKKLGKGPDGLPIDPTKGLPVFEHPFNRFGGLIMRPAFFVLDGGLVGWREVFTIGNRHRRSFHNLGLRAFEALSAKSPMLDPNNAAMVLMLYTMHYGPKGETDSIKAPPFAVLRVEWKEGAAARGWMRRANGPQRDRQAPEPVRPLDTSGLRLKERTVSGTVALPDSAERYDLTLHVKGAALAGLFKGQGDGAKAIGGILGDLDFGHAKLDDPPEWKVLVINVLGPSMERKDDLIVSFRLVDGKAADVKARCPAGDRKVEVKAAEIRVFGEVFFEGSVLVSVDGADYRIELNRSGLSAPYVTGVLGTSVVRAGFEAYRDGEEFKVEGRRTDYVTALVRNAWVPCLVKETERKKGSVPSPQDVLKPRQIGD